MWLRDQTHFSRKDVVENHASSVRWVVKVHVVKKVSYIPSLVTTVPKEI